MISRFFPFYVVLLVGIAKGQRYEGIKKFSEWIESQDLPLAPTTVQSDSLRKRTADSSGLYIAMSVYNGDCDGSSVYLNGYLSGACQYSGSGGGSTMYVASETDCSDAVYYSYSDDYCTTVSTSYSVASLANSCTRNYNFYTYNYGDVYYVKMTCSSTTPLIDANYATLEYYSSDSGSSSCDDSPGLYTSYQLGECQNFFYGFLNYAVTYTVSKGDIIYKTYSDYNCGGSSSSSQSYDTNSCSDYWDDDYSTWSESVVRTYAGASSDSSSDDSDDGDITKMNPLIYALIGIGGVVVIALLFVFGNSIYNRCSGKGTATPAPTGEVKMVTLFSNKAVARYEPAPVEMRL